MKDTMTLAQAVENIAEREFGIFGRAAVTSSLYYDQDGKPMDTDEWIKQFEDIKTRRIGYELVGIYRVSTVWLGLNHNYGDGPPLIFETMVFDISDKDSLGNYKSNLDMARYSTKKQAIAGHTKMVKKWGDQCQTGKGEST